MTARRPLPTIAPCRHCGSTNIGRCNDGPQYFDRQCLDCQATGPIGRDRGEADELWNRRSDAEAERRPMADEVARLNRRVENVVETCDLYQAEIQNLRSKLEKAERRGAMACVKWLRNETRGFSHAAGNLEVAIERGEVLPAKPEPWIVSRPGKMGGAPCVRGTRIPVTVLQPLAKQFSREQILGMYPGLTLEGLAAALAYKLPAKKGRKRI